MDSGFNLTTPNDPDFEGSIVLERLARIDAVEAFMDAVDSDDYEQATALMKEAGIDQETIAVTLKKMADPFDEH
jgi:hypothetical protein